jgi:hemerythrin
MSLFDWNEGYVVDQGMIDEQHKYLLKVTERLFNAVLDQETEDRMQECFDALLNYTKKHFHDEEEFFKSAEADQLDKHASEHEGLAGELIKVWEEEKLGFQEERGRVLLTWVEDRLIPHMMIDDQEAYKSCKSD